MAFVISRVLVLSGAGAVAAAKASAAKELIADGTAVNLPKNAVGSIIDTLTSWDGKWYFEIVRLWYPRSVPPNITYEQSQARAAFFPVFPALVRLADKVVPGGPVTAGIFVNAILGALFVLLIGVCAHRLYGPQVAGRTMLIASLFPGSFVLSFTYSEAAMLVLATACLIFLHDRRWLLAGVAAAVATATRPNAVALVAACLVAAVIDWRRRHDWRAFVAPALSPVGFVAFQIYISIYAHERGVWFRVQRQAWREGASYGATALRHAAKFLIHPFNSPTNVLTVASAIALIGGLYALRHAKLPAAHVVYTVAIAVLMLVPATVTARPRFVYTAFPLMIAVAKVWPKDREYRWSMMMTVFGGGLVAVTALYGLFAVAIP